MVVAKKPAAAKKPVAAKKPAAAKKTTAAKKPATTAKKTATAVKKNNKNNGPNNAPKNNGAKNNTPSNNALNSALNGVSGNNKPKHNNSNHHKKPHTDKSHHRGKEHSHTSHHQGKKGKKEPIVELNITPKTTLKEYLNHYHVSDRDGLLHDDQIKFFKEILSKNKDIKLVADIGFNTGHSADCFLDLRSDIIVVSFDSVYHRSPSKVAKKYLDGKYPNKHMLVGGDTSSNIKLFNTLYPDTKFDFIFIDGNHLDNGPADDMTNLRSVSHEKTMIVSNDLFPMRKFGEKPYEAWNNSVKKGELNELKIYSSKEVDKVWGVASYNFSNKKNKILADTKLEEFWKTDEVAIQLTYAKQIYNSANTASVKKIWKNVSNQKIKPNERLLSAYVRTLKKSSNGKNKDLEDLEKSLEKMQK
jgi:predicted O-methyltransferase YrrM